MEFPFPHKRWTGQEWDQIKNLTKLDLISLLDKDSNWTFVGVKGANYVYYNPQHKPPYDYLTIHYHREGYRNKGLLRRLLDHWCCTGEDLKRWKIIK
jgi:hypothetical protein